MPLRRWPLFTCTLVLLTLLVHVGLSLDSDPDPEPESGLWPRDLKGFSKGPKLTAEKQLLGELQEVLEKLQAKRLPHWEKKYGQVPTCDLGESCAVRKGARIGKLCDCPHGALCNFFLLKCL
ncbi:cocaine- and amphetamine-regulated transcript protein-like [Periophthalmus magnuspinnatus]|uniref:Cocaine- and amphetamine-regulated transcript protein n=1 Tax=Periophthalmus magnuspinnatus TaxID=409849 RepID=A0A3B3Z620_9GOBI|nr:cocaine- and amphetamine-regulated transcript protein-like [Periophthalmus magnuspinnatus]